MFPRVLLAVLIAGALGASGNAASPETQKPGGPGLLPLVNTPLGRLVSGTVGRFLVLRSEVNLTEQQRHQIRDVMVSHRAEIAATVKSVREQRLALRKAVLAEKTDEAAIRTAAEGLGKAIGDASVKAAKLRGELAPVLSAEQKELIHKFLAENEAVVSKFLDKVAQGK